DVADEVGHRVGAGWGRRVRHATRAAATSAAASSSVLGSRRANEAMQQQDAEYGRRSLRRGSSFSRAWEIAPPVHTGELPVAVLHVRRGECRLYIRIHVQD